MPTMPADLVARAVDSVRGGMSCAQAAAKHGLPERQFQRYCREHRETLRLPPPLARGKQPPDDTVTVWDGVNLYHRVLALLEATGRAHREHVARALAVPVDSVANTIMQLRRWGCVQPVGGGVWEPVP